MQSTMQPSQLKYNIRPESVDRGKDYEFRMITLLSLICIRESYKNWWIASNVDGFGACDDVILHQDGITYMMQLKHVDKPKRSIKADEFLKSSKGHFSFSKYLQDIAVIKESVELEVGKVYSNVAIPPCSFLQRFKVAFPSSNYKTFIVFMTFFIFQTIFSTFKSIYCKIFHRGTIPKVKSSLAMPLKSGIVKDLGTFNNINFILSTNRNVSKEFNFLDKNVQGSLSVLNTGTSIYKCDFRKCTIEALPDDFNLSYVDDCNFYLFPGQIHCRHTEAKIIEEIHKILKSIKSNNDVNIDKAKIIAERFTKFVTDWVKGDLCGDDHYCLTKHDVICKLCELMLYQYEVNLKQDYNKFHHLGNMNIWHEIVKDKVVTVIKADKNIFTFLFKHIANVVIKSCKKSKDESWSYILNEQEQNAFYQSDPDFKLQMLKIVSNSGKPTMLDIYKCLWMTNKLPLLLKVDTSQHFNTILKLLELSNYCYKVVLINSSGEPFVLPKLANKVKFFETLQDLDVSDAQKITKQKVKLQGRYGALLENLIDTNMHQYVGCSDIINILMNNFSIGNAPEPLPDYHIKRTLSKVFINSGVLEKNSDEIFLIEETAKETVKILRLQNITICNLKDVTNKKLRLYRIISTSNIISSEKIEVLQSSKKNIHHLSIHDADHLEWKSSFGSIKSIKHHRVELKNVIESVIENVHASKITIVTADPGMGKSVLMNYITYHAPVEKWVLKIDLTKDQYRQYYNSEYCKSDETECSEHLNYFKNIVFGEHKCNNDLNNAIFEKLVGTKDIIVLMDGFDEISITHKKEVTNIAKSLHNGGYHVCLTTRPMMKLYLEDTFNTFAINLTPFTSDKQKKFLIKYFDIANPDLNVEQKFLTKFVEKLLQSFKRNISDFDSQFTKIPLQASLLGDAFNDIYRQCVRNKSIANFNENFNLLDLYTRFIDKKIDFKFSSRDKDMRIIHGYKDYQSYYALKLLFPLHNLIIDKHLSSFCKQELRKIQLLQIEGTLTLDENFNINFAHRTFAEFLAAQWLAENFNNNHKELKQISQILHSERFTQNYKFLFSIFDQFMAKDCPLHSAIITGQVETAKKYSVDAEQLDKCKRSVLHMLALYGDRFPLISLEYSEFYSVLERPGNGMLDVVKQILKNKTINPDKDLLHYNPLDYALANRSLEVANEIRKHCSSVTINDYSNGIMDFRESSLVYCALFNYRPLFNVLLPYFAFRDFLLKNIDGNDTIDLYIENMITINKNRKIVQDFANEFMGMTTLKLLQSKYLYNYKSDLRYGLFVDSKENINLLLPPGDAINTQYAEGNTLLHYAVLHENIESVNWLLAYDADVNKQNVINNTPLHLVLFRKSLKSQLDKRLQFSNSGRIFEDASTLKNFRKGKTVIKTLRLPSTREKFVKDEETDKFCYNIVNQLLTKDPCVNMQNLDGHTPLHLALLSQEVDSADLLVRKGAKTTIQNKYGETPIHYAVKFGNNTVLLNLGKDDVIDKQDIFGNTALHAALLEGQLHSVKSLIIYNGANVNKQNGQGGTPLHYAVQSVYNVIAYNSQSSKVEVEKNSAKQFNVVKFLIRNGANINATNKRRETALHYTIKMGYIHILRSVLAMSEVENENKDFNDVPLYKKLAKAQFNIVKLLIRNGADINIRNNKKGETPLHYALLYNYDGPVKKSLPKWICRNEGITTSHHTILVNSHLDIVQLLISADGADFNIKDKKGKTALHYARDYGYSDIVEDILKQGNIVDEQNNLEKTPNTASIIKTNGDITNSTCETMYQSVGCYFDNNQTDIPLHSALIKGKLAAAKLLICKENVDRIDSKENTALHYAAQSGYDDIICNILDIDGICNKQNCIGNTPLHLAFINRHLNTANLLISKGADVNIQNDRRDTALHCAINNGFYDVANNFVGRGDYSTNKNKKGNTLFHLAIMKGQLNLVKLLISDSKFLNLPNKKGDTPLHCAINCSFYDIVKDILKKGGDINAQNNNGDTPLHPALTKGHLDTVKLLINSGANVNMNNNKGDTPIHFAIEFGLSDVLNEILAVGVVNNHQNSKKNTLLHLVLVKGLLSSAKLLIFNGANVNIPNSNGETALHCAVQNGNRDIVSNILAKSAVSNDMKDNKGNIPLHLAAIKGEVDIMKLLIVNGADVNTVNNKGQTILHCAVLSDFIDAVENVLALGVNINEQDNDGNTPFHLASAKGQLNIVHMLLSNKAEIDIVNKKGETALHYASKKGYNSIAKEIVRKNKKIINKQDNEDNTPLYLASLKGHLDVARLLISNNADLNLKNNRNETALECAIRKGHNSVKKEILSRSTVNKK